LTIAPSHQARRRGYRGFRGRHPPVAEAADVAHDRGEGGVVDSDERGSLDERTERVRFGADDTPAPLSAAFAELRAAVAIVATKRDVDTLTEVLWAALHGLTMLGRNDRLRPGRDIDRIELLVAFFLAQPRKGR